MMGVRQGPLVRKRPIGLWLTAFTKRMVRRMPDHFDIYGKYKISKVCKLPACRKTYLLLCPVAHIADRLPCAEHGADDDPHPGVGRFDHHAVSDIERHMGGVAF